MDVQIDGLHFSEDSKRSAGTILLSTVENRTVILNGIDLHLCAGHVVSIFGDDLHAIHSLVRTVALRQTQGYMEGSIYYDTVIRSSGLYRDIAYVPDNQDCFHFERLRVFESLFYAARLRTSQSVVECRERAREMARFLDLDGSSFVSTLSFTEKRLLSIAAELVANPSFLCLQFPTEGLDAAGALTVCRALHRVAKRNPGTTIFYSIPPPSVEMLRFTDEFVVLLKSSIAFCGQFLQGAQFASLLSAVTFELLHNSVSQSNPQKMHMALVQMQQMSPRVAASQRAPGSELGSPAGRSSHNDSLTNRRKIRDFSLPFRVHKPFFYEVYLLISRAWKYTRQTQYQLRMSVGRLTISGLVLGTIVFNSGSHVNDPSSNPVGNDGSVEQDTYNVTSTLFAIVAMTIIGVSLAVPFMHSHVRLLRQEVSCGLHRIFSCWLAILTLDIPLYILAATVMSALVYEMVSIDSASSDFFGTILMVTLVSYSMACACAVTFRSLATAVQVFSALGFLQLLMTGYVQLIPQMPAGWSWLSAASFTRWGFQALMIATFHNGSQDAYLEYFSFHDEGLSTCYTWLAVWLGIFQGIILLSLAPPIYGMKVESHQRRRTSTLASSPTVKSEKDIVLSPLRSNTAWTPSLMTASPTSTLEDVSLASPKAHELDRMEDEYAGKNTSSVQRDEEISGSLSLAMKRHGFPVVAIPAKMQADLVFTRLKYLSEGADGRPDVVVHSCTGRVAPGSSCCILSGSQDRTADILLRVLGGRTNNIGSVLGGLTVNDGPLIFDMQTEYYYSRSNSADNQSLRIYPKRINSAYVVKGDSVLWPELTIRETIHYCALLKRTDQRSCPNLKSIRNATKRMFGRSDFRGQSISVSEDDPFDTAEMIGNSATTEERVQELISMFRLDDVADQKLRYVYEEGNANSNTSNCALGRGRRRLCTIAQELVNRPGLILLEDPMHELSWDESEEVACAIVALSRGGRTVVCTLSNPAWSVFDAFDTTLLLGGGLQLYFGPRREAVTYFENIGFENSKLKSPSEFLLEIARGRGVIKKQAASNEGPVNWKGASVNLTLEDLADLYRSLGSVSNMASAGTAKKSAAEETFSKAIKVIKSDDKKAGIPLLYISPPLQPTARVQLMRSFAIVMPNRLALLFYAMRSLLAGIVLGSVWYGLDSDAYQVKMNLFACTYIFVNLALVDLFDGLHKRFDMYKRERETSSATPLSYWLSDPTASFWLNALCCLMCSLPVYYIADLRTGSEYFGYFYLLLLSTVYCNTGFAFLLSTFTSCAITSRLVFNGILMPLQIVFSGFLILLPSMASWFSWLAYICPMSYFLAGMLSNEYEGNDEALAEGVTFDSLEDIYGFSIPKYSALIVTISVGLIYKLLWLLSLYSEEAASDIRTLRKVEGRSRITTRRILSAGLRWRGVHSKSRSSVFGPAMYSNAFMESNDDYISGLEADMFDTDQQSLPTQRGASWSGAIRNFLFRSTSQSDANPAAGYAKRSMPGLGSGDMSSRGGASRHGISADGTGVFELFEDDSSAYHELM